MSANRTPASVESHPSNRRRALLLDVCILFGSAPLLFAYLRFEGRVSSLTEFWPQLAWILPASLAAVVVHRVLQSRDRGSVEVYDYEAMNPTGFFNASDLVSPVPHISWHRSDHREAFFEAVIDQERFVDTPGFALSLHRPYTADVAMEMLRVFRPATRLWHENDNVVHAVFDAPPSSANQWTSDFGARMWASARDDGSGGCHLRVVFGSGGFGQGQPAEALPRLVAVLPAGALTAVFTDAVLAVEAEFRGAAGWWILVGQHFGVAPAELAAVDSWRLQVETVTGTVRSIKPRRILRLATTTLLGFLALIAAFVLA